jgi:hypothetical protein
MNSENFNEIAKQEPGPKTIEEVNFENRWGKSETQSDEDKKEELDAIREEYDAYKTAVNQFSYYKEPSSPDYNLEISKAHQDNAKQSLEKIAKIMTGNESAMINSSLVERYIKQLESEISE